MITENNMLFPEDGKAIYRKRDGFGPIYGVRFGFITNEDGIVMPDTADNYEEKKLDENGENN